MMTTQDHVAKGLQCYPATTRIEQDECHPPERYRLGVQGVEPSVTLPNMDSMPLAEYANVHVGITTRTALLLIE